jgi:serine/threonine protein phosphatase PrpC
MPSLVFWERPTRVHRAGWSAREVAVDADAWSGKGADRTINEDAFISASVGYRPGCRGAPLLLAVADGRGGEEADQGAGFIATRSLVKALSDLPVRRIGSEPAAVLREAAHGAHGDILTAGLVVWPWVHLVHAGETHCYHLHHGTLRLLTKDHPTAEVLARCLLEPGDALLFTTDGLSDALGEGELADIASRPCSAHAVCHMLVEAARAKGTHDDATAVFARFGLPL